MNENAEISFFVNMKEKHSSISIYCACFNYFYSPGSSWTHVWKHLCFFLSLNTTASARLIGSSFLLRPFHCGPNGQSTYSFSGGWVQIADLCMRLSAAVRRTWKRKGECNLSITMGHCGGRKQKVGSGGEGHSWCLMDAQTPDLLLRHELKIMCDM